MVTFVLLAGMGTGVAESHPAWWRYASPEATALVGIQWEHLGTSPFAAAISGELSGDDGLGFPDLDCLKHARQIVISSPVLLAMAAGDFPAATVREQAVRKGLKRTLYHEVEIWVTPGKETLSVALMNEQLLLLGKVKNLQDTIDRNLLEQTSGFSPLLARAAHYAQEDLWVVATRLPDDLAERFIPIDAETEGFEGGVSLAGGLKLKALFTTSSEETADHLVDTLKGMLVALPMATQGIELRIDQNNVSLSMAVTEAQLAAGLKTTAPPVVAKAAPKPEPMAAAPVVAKPATPQVIRIYGLDEGPREIVMR
jgi:hypothetical protein